MKMKMLVVAVALLVVFLGGHEVAAAASTEEKCGADFPKLTVCLTYATGKAAVPTKDCCNSVQGIKDSEPECLCFLVQQIHKGDDKIKSMGIQESKLLSLPTACTLKNATLAECPSEAVDRPKLSTAKLGRVEHILSLDESLRSTAVLNTAQNRLLYGLSVILQPPIEPVAPPAFLLGAVPSDMKFNVPPRPRKRSGSSSSKSASQPDTSVDPSPGIAEAQSQGAYVITPGSKRPRVEEPIDLTVAEEPTRQPRRRDKGKEVSHLTGGPLQMPGSKVNDPMFLVTDVADRNLTSALRLPDRFSLPIQAIYSHFNPDSWEKFTKMNLLDRSRVAVIRQISALEATLLNYVEVADLLEKETPSRAAQEEILSLGILRDELQSSLDLEKTKVKSLEEAIVREKSDSFKEGCSKGVEEFLASDNFQQKKREAVEEFLRSEEYHRSIASLIASFKASQEYKDAVAEDVEKFKSSAAFEELVSQRLEDYQDSAEFEELQLTLMKSAGEQILDRFRKKRPDVDLAFLDESDSEEVVPVEGEPVEQTTADGAEQGVDAATVEPDADEEHTSRGEATP